MLFLEHVYIILVHRRIRWLCPAPLRRKSANNIHSSETTLNYSWPQSLQLSMEGFLILLLLYSFTGSLLVRSYSPFSIYSSTLRLFIFKDFWWFQLALVELYPKTPFHILLIFNLSVVWPNVNYCRLRL